MTYARIAFSESTRGVELVHERSFVCVAYHIPESRTTTTGGSARAVIIRSVYARFPITIVTIVSKYLPVGAALASCVKTGNMESARSTRKTPGIFLMVLN